MLLVLPHEDPNAKLSLPPGPLERNDFDVRSFAREHALRTDGGGAFMWRAVWDEESSRIWGDVISEHLFHPIWKRDVDFIVEKSEPRYGYPPKLDNYTALKEAKKYT